MANDVKRYTAMIENTRGLWDKHQVVIASDHDRIVASLQAQIERAVSATNAECNDWAREYELRMEVTAERDQLAERCRELDAQVDGIAGNGALAEERCCGLLSENAALRSEVERLATVIEDNAEAVTLRAEVERLQGALAIAHSDASHYASTAAVLRDEVDGLRKDDEARSVAPPADRGRRRTERAEGVGWVSGAHDWRDSAHRRRPGGRAMTEKEEIASLRELLGLAGVVAQHARVIVGGGGGKQVLVTIELADDEVLVALRRPEGYEDTHHELVAEDAIRESWPEYRTIHGDEIKTLGPSVK